LVLFCLFLCLFVCLFVYLFVCFCYYHDFGRISNFANVLRTNNGGKFCITIMDYLTLSLLERPSNYRRIRLLMVMHDEYR
jgi:hypothetical protein